MALEACWVCPSSNRRKATWMQQVDDDRHFTPLCDTHYREADHKSHRYTYYKAGTEPRLTPAQAAAGINVLGQDTHLRPIGPLTPPDDAPIAWPEPAVAEELVAWPDP